MPRTVDEVRRAEAALNAFELSKSINTIFSEQSYSARLQEFYQLHGIFSGQITYFMFTLLFFSLYLFINFENRFWVGRGLTKASHMRRLCSIIRLRRQCGSGYNPGNTGVCAVLVPPEGFLRSAECEELRWFLPQEAEGHYRLDYR